MSHGIAVISVEPTIRTCAACAGQAVLVHGAFSPQETFSEAVPKLEDYVEEVPRQRFGAGGKSVGVCGGLGTPLNHMCMLHVVAWPLTQLVLAVLNR